MSAAPEPVEPAPTRARADRGRQLARDRLHEEIERVRNGVEEMLDEQESADGDQPADPSRLRDRGVRRELEKLRVETRDYVKKQGPQVGEEASQERSDELGAHRRARTADRPGRGGPRSRPSGASTQHRGDARRAARGPLDRRPARQAARSPPPQPTPRHSRRHSRRRSAGSARPPYSVEMLGSAWTLCGTTIRKFSGALAASSRIRSASSSWSVARSSSA